jgi:soluble lytic murein transglycosylase-like protein
MRWRHLLLVPAALSSTFLVGNAEAIGSYDREGLRALVLQVSREHGVDPKLVDALVVVESDYDPFAVSRTGAVGLMQLMPSTVRRLNINDPFDPEQNVRAGVQEFRRLIDRYSGNLHLALAAYNAGEGAVAQYQGVPPFAETRQYVLRIMSLYTGQPYTFGSMAARPRQPVRLVRQDGEGGPVITNLTANEERATAQAQSPGALRGGFGQ